MKHWGTPAAVLCTILTIAQAGTPASSGTGTLEVRVEWQDYELGVTNAKVSIGERSLATDKRGECTFRDLDAGMHLVRVRAERYRPREPVLVEVKPGKTTRTSIPLTPRLRYYVLHLVKTGCMLYVLIIGLCLICINYFVSPQPYESLTWVGKAFALTGVLLAAARLPALMSGPFVALGAAATVVLVRYGRSWARTHVRPEEPPRPKLEERIAHRRQELEGRCGTTTSALRPAGTADFGSGSVEVVSAAGYMPQGIEVKVLSVRPGKVIVSPAETPAEAPSP